jgi:hypothetical protein
VIFLCQVPGLFQMVCELFFGLRAPLSNNAHLLGRRIFMTDGVPWLAGPCGATGAGMGEARIGVFAHNRIVPQHLTEKKRLLLPDANAGYGGRRTVSG